MEQCEQAPGLNMLQHGQAVHESYKTMISQLESNTFKYSELDKIYQQFKHSLPRPDVLKNYHVYHDCGKHICLQVVDGKRHFPNHAEISSKQFELIFPEDGFTKTLILKDLDFHISKGDDLLKLCKHPLSPILYFTAWAEILANSKMFGGEESESFKIKKSRLIQAGKKLIKGEVK